MVNLHLLNQAAAKMAVAENRSNSIQNSHNATTSSSNSYINSNDNPNKLQMFLKKQDQQARISNSNISSNFHIITQYILQSYFKVQVNQLSSLKIADLIVDQTYPDSITLRKLNENTSITPYVYFNTISRDEDITRCPIFALAIYFVIRWSHPNPPISVENFDNISLLDFNFINHSNANIAEFNDMSMNDRKISRSQNFLPSDDLISLVFPWLSPLKQDMLLIDRTNYKLNSFVELFEFLAKTMIQDLKFLNQKPDLLPNIVSFVAKFIPDLFRNEQFKFTKIDLTTSTSDYKSNTGDNDYRDDNAHFLELSKRLTTENIRLSQQITQLKSDLYNVHSMCDQILQLQKQLMPGSYDYALDNSRNGAADTDSNSNNGGIIILDKNSLNPSMLSNLVQSIEDTRHQSAQLQQPQQPQVQQADTPSLAPINAFSSFNNSMPSIYTPQQQQLQPQQRPHQQQQSQQQHDMKRKLPLPTTATPGTVPFSPSPGSPSVGTLASVDAMYSKRFRYDDKPTASQTALDSLLSKSIGSPRYSTLQQNQAAGANPTSYSSQRIASRFASPANFPVPGTPSAVVNSPDPSNQLVSYVPRAQPQESEQQASSTLIDNSLIDDTTGILDKTDETNQIDNSSRKLAQPGPTEQPINEKSSLEANYDANDNKTSRKKGSSSDSNDEKSPRSTTNEKETGSSSKKMSQSGEKVGPNRHIKYKLSRENKTIWDLYTEWYVGLNGKPSIKNLIENYGWRRWKVSDDSHFFPTRRIIMDYIETECDRGIKLGRFTNPDQPREDIRKILVGDLEKFRINNGLTLNSLSMYFKNLTKENKEICIFENFENWTVRGMSEEDKTNYCKRQHIKEN